MSEGGEIELHPWAQEGDSTLDLRPWIENWWRQTKNPLYAWEAISRALNGGGYPPGWAMAYLKDAAEKMRLLAMGQDFRRPDGGRISPGEAMKLVGQAFGLVAPRTKNAFARRADDANASYAALEMDDAKDRVERGGRIILYVENGEVKEPPTPRSIKKKAGTANHDRDRTVQRAVERGRKLNRPSD